MTNFMDADFLLSTETARTLYHTYAEKLPILDYHCHISPEEIWLDKRYENITQLWLGVGGSHFGDHYKWRFMRSCGVEEQYITGTAPDEERFVKWVECLEKAIGNPLLHWSYLELRKYFGYDGILSGKNAREVYRFCNEKLKSPSLSVRGILRQSNVKLICTTDDPADSLIWHRKIAADDTLDVKVLPAMRPDKARKIAEADYPDYLRKLGAAADIEIATFADLKTALRKRMDVFGELGCRVADHGLNAVVYEPASEEMIEAIFARRQKGESISETECRQYETAFMLFVEEEYARRGWVSQLHYGCKRDNNRKLFRMLGPDTGYDCIGDSGSAWELTEFLNALEEKNALPRSILYSLDPNDNARIASVIGCFQSAEAIGKLQLGSAWWFNDHLDGMTAQLKTLANLGNLSGFVGMLTDSRSFLSYTRHDYFRRILCRIFGEWVEEGMYPADVEALGRMVEDIGYRNAVRYFGFPL